MANEVYDTENPDRTREGNIRNPGEKGERTAGDFAPIDSGGGRQQNNRQVRDSDGNDGGLQRRAGIMGKGTASDFAPSAAEKSEQTALGNATDDFFNDDDEPRKKGIRGWSRRKKAASGGLAGLIGAGAVTGIFLISSGPFQFMQMGNLLRQFHMSNSDSFTNGRAAKLIQYARTRNNPQVRNLDYFGNKITDHYKVKLSEAGIEHGYNDRARIAYVDVDPETRAGKQAIAEMERLGLSSRVEGTKTRFDLTGERAKVRRAAINTTVDAVGMNGVSNAMSARLLKIRGGVSLHPLQNISRAADERLFAYIESRRKTDADYISNGTSDGPQRVSVDEPPDGADDADDAAAASDSTTADEGNEAIRTANDPDIDVSARAGRLRASVTAGVGVAGFISLVCGVQQIGEESAALQSSNIVKPLIRTGMQVISISDQLKSGQDVNLDELGALSKSLYDEQNKTSWSQSQSILANQGKENAGVPMDKSAIPGTEKPAFFKELDSALNAIPGSSGVCEGVTSTAGNIALTVGGIAFASTGPFSAVANALAEGGQTLLANAFMDDLVRWIAGEQVATDVAGAMFGNYGDAGVFLANNDTMSSLGGRELSATETVQLREEQDIIRKQELQEKNLFARLLDLREPGSLASKTVLENPTFASTQSATNGMLQAPLRNMSSILNNVSSIFMPQLQAAPAPYDYGVPEIGYSEEEINSDIAEDPYENASYVEANIQQLDADYGECFGTTISPETGTIQTSNVTSYIDRGENCSSTSEDFLRYRYYLADMTIAQTLTCYPGLDEESCANLGFENEADDSSSGELPDGVVGIEEIVDIPPWLGLGRGCHQSIAARTKEMLEAASADGVELRGDCWRSSEEQMRLRIKHCPDPINSPASACSPPTAPVGNSNHERGLAIDFRDCSNGSACFNWLSANAETYGFFNLPSESWHWSVDGS